MAQSPCLPSVPRAPPCHPTPGPVSLSLTRAPTQLPGHVRQLLRPRAPHCRPIPPLPTTQEPAPGSLPGRLGSPAVLGGQALPGGPAGHKAPKAALEGRQGYCMSPRGPGHPILASHTRSRSRASGNKDAQTGTDGGPAAAGGPDQALHWPRGARCKACSLVSANAAQTVARRAHERRTDCETRWAEASQTTPPRQRTDGPRGPSVGSCTVRKDIPSHQAARLASKGMSSDHRPSTSSTGPAPPAAWGSALCPLLTPVRVGP